MKRADHFYLSFVDDSGFLGGVFLDAVGAKRAVVKAWRLGINPGGEVGIYPLPALPPAEWCNRLLTADEVRACPPPVGFAT